MNPLYGTEADFKAMIDAAHAHGIEIYLDYVLNHSGKGNPWFKQALADASSPYRDYYFISSKPSSDYSKFPMLTGTSYNSGEWKQVNDKDWGEESRTVSHQFELPKKSVLQWKVVDASGTAESKMYTIGGVRDPKAGINRRTRSAKFSFTPATPDTGIVKYKLRVDDTVYDLGEQSTYTRSGISNGRHTWAVQGVYADGTVTGWLPCGTFTMQSN